jgi:hypothetical protein
MAVAIPNPPNNEDDASTSTSSSVPVNEQAEAMAVMMTMENPQHPRATTAAERAIMGTVDAQMDGNIQDFIFLDENGQLVQQRFLQFLNS